VIHIKLNRMFNRNGRCSIALLLFVFSFLLTVPSVFSQGEIYSIYIDPEKPLILEEFIINIGVQNTDNKTNDYILDVFVSKEGQVKDENSFAFSLKPDRGVLFSPRFTPNAVGKYEIFAKLYDKYKVVVYHTRILDVNVISDIGPFDLSLDALSRTVGPNKEIPLIVSMKNVGLKGTDAKIDVRIDCLDQEDIYKDFFVFLKGNSDLEKFLTLTACNEEGRRNIMSKLILFDHTFAESLTQIVINDTYYDFDIEFPKLIKIKQGESKTFGVFIKNTAEISLNNLRLVIENIPLEWTKINPATIVNIRPNDTAVFLVNISIPQDASVIEYPIVITIGSDETLVQKDSTLKVITGEFVAPEVELGLLIPEELRHKLTILTVGIALGALIVILYKLTIRKRRRSKKEVLIKIKDMIE